MADYAGAVAAMKARFVTQWAAGPNTAVAYQNQKFDLTAQSTPWVYFEVIGNTSDLRGAGMPGNHVWLYEGSIRIHVFVPADYGVEDAQTFAVTAGEIFRAATFYNSVAGEKVICGAPRTDGGATDADNGNWFRLTCTVPFEYYHVG